MWIYILTGIPVLFLVLWKLVNAYFNSFYDYWRQLGVPVAVGPGIPNAVNVILGRLPLHDLDEARYTKCGDAPYIGFVEFRTPALLIRDLELVKQITVKDFDHFVNRRAVHMGKDMNEHFIVSMKGSHWKRMRCAITPTFTSGKMRRMFEHFEKSARDLGDYVARKGECQSGNTRVIETRETFARFTMDVIGSVAFGIDSQCLTDDDSMFYKMGQIFQKIDFLQGLKFITAMTLPSVAEFFNVEVLPKTFTGFFNSITMRTLTTRRENYSSGKKNNGPSDFIQLMMEAQKHELKEENENEEVDADDSLAQFERDSKIQIQNQSGKKVEISDMFIQTTGIIFFLAGFDNTEALLSVASYHLAVHPKIQEKLREEVDRIVAEDDGKVTYDGVVKMTYLDMFISECLRLFPPGPRFDRLVTKKYTIPATSDGKYPAVTLPVGTVIVFPIMSFHKDPQHFPNPDQFDPEQFSPENKAKRHPYAYMPFGHGPRSCIAMRFALTELRAAVAHLVHSFEIQTCKETTIPLKLIDRYGLHRPAAGLKLALVKRR